MTRPLTICGTGHRPKKITVRGRNAYDPSVHRLLIQLARQELQRIQPDVVISGMALGWDTALAEAALALGIRLAAYVPFSGQESTWPPASQRRFHELLAAADVVRIISKGGYTAAKMQLRNEAMVEMSDVVLALWNGDLSGGTFNCVQYARSRRAVIENVWPEWLRLTAGTPPLVGAAR